jgi:hypothetical protein
MKRPTTCFLYSTCGLETHTRMTASHPESWYSKADGLKRAGVNQVYLATAEMRRFHAPHKPKLAYGERPARTAAFLTGRFGAKAGLNRWTLLFTINDVGVRHQAVGRISYKCACPDSFCCSRQGREIAANQRFTLFTIISSARPSRNSYTSRSRRRLCIMVLGILTAIAACPAIIGTTEAVRQGQRQSAREKHRGLKTNLSVNCSRASSGGREIDGCAVVLSNDKVRRVPFTKPRRETSPFPEACGC